MATLTNSQRRTYKATYVPLGGFEKESTPDAPSVLLRSRRAIDKTSFVASLFIDREELRDLKTAVDTATDAERTELVAAYHAVEDAVSDTSPGGVMRQAQRFAFVDGQLLVRFGRTLAQARRTRFQAVEQTLQRLQSQHQQARRAAVDPRAIVRATRVAAPMPGDERRPEAPSEPPALSERTTPPSLPSLCPPPSLGESLAWACESAPELDQEIHRLARAVAPRLYALTALTTDSLEHRLRAVRDFYGYTETLSQGFEDRFKITPVGILHLERLEMTPVGLERGELVHSVPLTPKETVNISHREWSTRSEEFEKIVTDFFEGYSEEGVAEKTELAQSTESQSKREQGLDVNASLTASYGVVTLSSSAGYTLKDSQTSSEKDSRNHAISITRKASARIRKENKFSFRVSSAAGTEDQAVRVITNPSNTDPMRVDYYQLMRKWRVDLYRYGLRMTYDIIAPSPGIDVIRKQAEIRWIDAQLNKPLNFPITVAMIDPSNYLDIAQQLGVSGPGDLTPPAPTTLYKRQDIQHPNNDEVEIESIDFDIDDPYEISGGVATIHSYGTDPDSFFRIDSAQIGPGEGIQSNAVFQLDLPFLAGGEKKQSLVFRYYKLKQATVEVRLYLAVKDATLRDWKLRVWSVFRDNAEQNYLQGREALRQRREQLQAEIAAVDALTLRRMEQEEIMKVTMRWLFGPDFDFSPDQIAAMYQSLDPSDPALTDVYEIKPVDPLADPLADPHVRFDKWRRVMEFGELVKFLHQAIEWENVLHFAYPYFGSVEISVGRLCI